MPDFNYPSNSLKSREAAKAEPTDRKKVEKVVSGNVKAKKKNDFQKFFGEVISENFNKAKEYVVQDIIIPSIKNAITKTVDVIIWGDDRNRNRPINGSKIPYSKYYDQPYRRDGDRGYSRPETPRGFSYDEIVLEDRGDAEQVLSQMDDLITEYQFATVADLYDLVGMSCDYTYNKYGWTNLRNAEVRRVRDGYLLVLPKALPLK